MKTELQGLKDKLINNEIQISKLNNEIYLSKQHSNDLKLAERKIRELESELFLFKERDSLKENEHKRTIKEIEVKYEYQIDQLKYDIQLINSKYETVNRYDKYINGIEILNEDLIKKLERTEVDYHNNLVLENEKFQIKADLIKKKSLHIINESKKKMQLAQFTNSSVSHKLLLIQNAEYRNELTEQSKLLESLLDEIKQKDIIVRRLKTDIEVHVNVEKILTTHNKRMVEIIKTRNDGGKIQGLVSNSSHSPLRGNGMSNKTFYNVKSPSCNKINFDHKEKRIASDIIKVKYVINLINKYFYNENGLPNIEENIANVKNFMTEIYNSYLQEKVFPNIRDIKNPAIGKLRINSRNTSLLNIYEKSLSKHI